MAARVVSAGRRGRDLADAAHAGGRLAEPALPADLVADLQGEVAPLAGAHRRAGLPGDRQDRLGRDRRDVLEPGARRLLGLLELYRVRESRVLVAASQDQGFSCGERKRFFIMLQK